MTTLNNRYDFVLIFDVKNGNPNGDPDAGNLPRQDPETSHGFVSDVCLKRKIRNYVEFAKEGQDGHNIYVQEGSILNEKHRDAYKAIRPDEKALKSKNPSLKPKDGEGELLKAYMCKNFYDIRTFGAVMSTTINCGKVRGPVQMTFATSAEPIIPLEMTITRMARTKHDDKATENQSMGRKHIVPYGLYRAHGFISAKLADKTGFDEQDLNLLWESLAQMFDHDHSATRGEMYTRKLILFKHNCAFGNTSAHELFDRVKIGRNIEGEFTPIKRDMGNIPPAREFSDYMISIDQNNLPDGVSIIEQV